MYYDYVFLYQTFVKNKCVIWKVTEIVINIFFGIQHSRTIIWPGGSNENHSTYIVWTATAGGLDIRPARVKGTLLGHKRFDAMGKNSTSIYFKNERDVSSYTEDSQKHTNWFNREKLWVTSVYHWGQGFAVRKRQDVCTKVQLE